MQNNSIPRIQGLLPRIGGEVGGFQYGLIGCNVVADALVLIIQCAFGVCVYGAAPP